MNKSRQIKAAVIATGILTVVSAALIFIGVILANTDTAGAWLQDRINSRLNGHLAIEDHRLSFWGQHLDVTGLQLSAAGGETVLGIDHLRLETSLSALFHRKLKITTLRLENITAELTADPDGRLNLVNILPAEQPAQDTPDKTPEKTARVLYRLFLPRTVVVESLQLSNIHITHQTTDGPIEMRCPALSFSGEADLTGQTGNVTAQGQGLHLGTPALSLLLQTLDIKTTLHNGHLDPLLVEATTPFGSIRVSGHISRAFTRPSVDLAVQSTADLAGINDLLSTDHDLSGQTNVKAVITGSFDSPVVQADVTCHEAMIGPVAIGATNLKISGQGISPDQLAAKISGQINIAGFGQEVPTTPVPLIIGMDACYEHGVIQLDRLSAVTGGTNLIGHGRYTIKTGDIAARFKLNADDIRDLSALAGYTDVSGGLEVTAEVSDTLFKPTVRVDVKGNDLAIASLNLDDVTGRATLSRGRLVVDDLDIRRRESHLQADGTIRLFDEQTGKLSVDPAIDLTISQSNVNLDDVATGTVKGNVTFSGRIAGTIGNPVGNLSLHSAGLDIGIMRTEKINSVVKLAGDVIEVSSLDVSFADGESLRGSGTLSVKDKTYCFDAVSEKLSLHQVRPLHDSGFFKGTARLALSGKGAWWEMPCFDGDIYLQQLTIADKALDNISINISFNDRLIDLLVNGDITATGTLDLADMTFSTRCEMAQTDLGPWFNLADRPDMGGLLTGRLEAAGRLTDIAAMTASAEIEQAVLSHKQRDLIHVRPFHLNYRDGVVNIPGIQLTVTEKDTVDISGHLGIDGTIALDIDGSTPLAVAALYAPEIMNPTGRLILDARVAGTFDNPDVAGDLTLINLGLSLPDMSHNLHDINGSIGFQPGKVTINKIHGGLGSGRFQVTGGASLDGFLPTAIDVRLQAESLPVVVQNVMDLKLNAALTFVKDREQSIVRGEVILLDGIYTKDARIAGYTDIILSPFEKRRELPPVSKNRLPSFLKNLLLDVAVKHRLPLKVDNNIALLEIQPDIAITGSADNPVFMGQARVDSGELLFQGTTFLVEKGVVSFTNPYKTEAHIDITAGTTVKQWAITLKATGTPDQLDVELTSDPPETQGDILSLLIFGKPSRDMGGADGAAQTPAQILAAFFAEKVADDIKSITGLDIVEISTRENEDEEDTVQSRVTLGSKVSERLTFKYSIKSGQTGMVQESVSEYRLTENTTVSGFQDNRGIFGGRLIYRLEFR